MRILLIIIYISFISLGLPDSLIGSAWPVMHTELGVPLSFAGIITMTVSVGTIISSLFSGKLLHKFGTGLVNSISVIFTAVAMIGFSVSTEIWQFMLWAIPFGLGAGAVDAALNNFVALHYSSRHMSWLHSFWGVGASISPYIMSYALKTATWATGFRIVAAIQFALALILFVTLPLWKKSSEGSNSTDTSNTVETIQSKSLSIKEAVKIKGVPFILIAFLGYCALESTAGLWAGSYLFSAKGVSTVTAAKFASLFYLGITAGRFLCGFVADRFGDRTLIRTGLAIITAGLALLIIPFNSYIPALVGLIVVGFGCAPIYPSIIHATPSNFGAENSQSIIGIQMASAYVGSTFMPPIFGLIAGHISISLYPIFLAIFLILMVVMLELLNKKVDENKVIEN